MDIIEIRNYLLSLPLVEEGQPFGEDVLVFTIGGKMFASYSFTRSIYLAVKCDPDRAILLRDAYDQITYAWHFNKKYWNDLCFERLPRDMVCREIRHAYFQTINRNVSPKPLRLEILQAAAAAGICDDAPAAV